MRTDLNPLVETELAAVDWSSLRVIEGRDAGQLPDSVARLLTAETEEAAEEAYWKLDNRAVVQGQLFESAEYLVPVLLAGLAGPLSTPAQRALADLLVEICSGGADESEVALGNDDLGQACREAVQEGIWLIYGLLLHVDPRVRDSALRIIRAVDRDQARTVRTLRRIAVQDDDEHVRQAALALLDETDRERSDGESEAQA